MKCKKCGAELPENAKFCSECGTETVGQDENIEPQNIQSQSEKKGFFNDKKNIIIGILSIAVVVLLCFTFIFNTGLPLGKKGYDGTYSSVGSSSPIQITIKDGNMAVTRSGDSFAKEYEYDETSNTISAKNNQYEFLLREVDGEYFFGITNLDGSDYSFGFDGETQVYKEGTQEKDNAQQKLDEATAQKDKEEQEVKEKASKFGGTNLSGDQKVIVGQTIEPGIYSFAPASGEDYYSIDVYENETYYNQDKEGTSSDYIDHYESYYGDEITEGGVLNDGMVIDIDYHGVQYKRQ